jgi:hypothetical protein
MYTLNELTGIVTRDSDGSICAPCESIEDPLFIEYHNWIEAGNSPNIVAIAPFDPIAYEKDIIDRIQFLLDSTAMSRGYDSILSAASYAVSNHPRFGVEGRAFSDWRDAVWDKCNLILHDVNNGLRSIPSVDQIISELPALSI